MVVTSATLIYMGKVLRTLAPVDSMSGMIGKREETISFKAFIVNLKKVGGVKHKGMPFMYFSLRQRDRSTPITANEVAIRKKFTAVVAATRARLIDPEYIHTDQLAFKAQTVYPTLYGYVFKQCWDSYSD